MAAEREAEQRRRLEEILRATSDLMDVLRVARELALPDWMVFSGAIYQPVLNQLTGRPTGYGRRDFDLVYFDASDLSYEAEDAVIRRVRATAPAPLQKLLEVRNQARVHLWFEDKFGEPYEPLKSSEEALTRFPCVAFAVGARLEPDDRLTVFAPFGLNDLFALRLRPNALRITPWFTHITSKATERWPEVQVVGGGETRTFP